MKLPNFEEEMKLWKKGYKVVAGADEVGRGSFAGPVVAAAVSFKDRVEVPEGIYIRDSKKLSEKRREEASRWIKENSLTYAVGESSVRRINREGMGKATFAAFRKAVKKANARLKREDINFLLVDAFYVPYLDGFPVRKEARQKPVEKGDERSFLIAAASIIAKVYRDSLMKKLAQKEVFSPYLWHKNKGYGTQEHREAIAKHGVTKHHRLEFVKDYI